ncbi:hypothetical protein EWR62_21575 [Salmonella enterica]|nr:hypothetical protein [Salmonella enterica]
MCRMLNAGRKKSRECGFYHRSDELSEGGQSRAGSEPSLYGFSNGKPHGIPILYMIIIAHELKPTSTASIRILNFCFEWRNDITIPQYDILRLYQASPIHYQQNGTVAEETERLRCEVNRYSFNLNGLNMAAIFLQYSRKIVERLQFRFLMH